MLAVSLDAYPSRLSADNLALEPCSFDDTAVLRCEMAHKNMYFKDTDPTAKRPKHAAPVAYEQYGTYPGYGYPATTQQAPVHPSAYQQVHVFRKSAAVHYAMQRTEPAISQVRCYATTSEMNHLGFMLCLGD